MIVSDVTNGRAKKFIHSTITDFNNTGIIDPGIIRSHVPDHRMQNMLYFRLKRGLLR